jgi:hypothetical protein
MSAAVMEAMGGVSSLVEVSSGTCSGAGGVASGAATIGYGVGASAVTSMAGDCTTSREPPAAAPVIVAAGEVGVSSLLAAGAGRRARQASRPCVGGGRGGTGDGLGPAGAVGGRARRHAGQPRPPGR